MTEFDQKIEELSKKYQERLDNMTPEEKAAEAWVAIAAIVFLIAPPLTKLLLKVSRGVAHEFAVDMRDLFSYIADHTNTEEI